MLNYQYCVDGYNNDSRYPEEFVVRSHVTQLKFNFFQKIELKRPYELLRYLKG